MIRHTDQVTRKVDELLLRYSLLNKKWFLFCWKQNLFRFSFLISIIFISKKNFLHNKRIIYSIYEVGNILNKVRHIKQITVYMWDSAWKWKHTTTGYKLHTNHHTQWYAFSCIFTLNIHTHNYIFNWQTEG
jgi:hypothetical protein